MPLAVKFLIALLPFLITQSDGGPDGDGGDDGDGDDQSGGTNAGVRAGKDDGAGDDDDGSDDRAELKSALAKERKAARDAQRALKAVQDKLNQIEAAGKPEEERREQALKDAETRAEAAERRLREANARSAVTDAATKANALSPRAIYALVADDLEFDDDGEPTNVTDLVAQAKKDEPALFRAAQGSGDGGKQSSATRDVKPGFDRLSHAYETQSKTAARTR